MPQYVSVSGMVDRYGQEYILHVSDRGGDQDIDTEAVARAVYDAEGETDTYLATRVTLPLPGVTDIAAPEENTSVPAVLRRIVSDIAVYRLASEHDQLTKEKRRRYEDALAWLKMYAEGKVSLGVEPSGATEGTVYVSTAERLFTRRTGTGLI